MVPMTLLATKNKRIAIDRISFSNVFDSCMTSLDLSCTFSVVDEYGEDVNEVLRLYLENELIEIYKRYMILETSPTR